MKPSPRRLLPHPLPSLVPLALLFTSSLSLLFALSAGGCDKTNPDDFHRPERPDAGTDSGAGEQGPEEVTFPTGFLWGSSTSAFQTEKTGNVPTDWAKWVLLDGKIKGGGKPDVGGPDALNHIDEDVAALKASGQNAYRFSIEWARIYPTKGGAPDAAALAVYDSLVSKLRAAGIRPVLTLNHLVLPAYFSDVTKPTEPQGWERPETSDAFAQYCSAMAAHFKDRVDDWLTINEPFVTALSGYLDGTAPPGRLALDEAAVERGLSVVRAQARAHARCYEAIHAADTVDANADGISAWVSIAANQQMFRPASPDKPEDVNATKHADYVWNLWFYNAIARGDWDDDFDGTYDGPNDKRADPTLAKHVDFLGINYYSDVLVSSTGLVIPKLGFSVVANNLPTPRPKTDFALDIDPEGFRFVLMQAKDYGLPVIITENGLADAADKNRARFITEHVYQAGWALKNGVDLRGYFYWSLMDNFEWDSGFCPKFGLYSVALDGGARTARGSVATYKAIIEANKVRRDSAAALPPYAEPTICP